MEATRFDFSLWKKRLTDLGYPLSESKIPTQFLRDRRAIPPGVNLKEAKLVYNDPLGIDIIVLEFDRMPSRIWAETHDLHPVPHLQYVSRQHGDIMKIGGMEPVFSPDPSAGEVKRSRQYGPYAEYAVHDPADGDHLLGLGLDREKVTPHNMIIGGYHGLEPLCFFALHEEGYVRFAAYAVRVQRDVAELLLHHRDQGMALHHGDGEHVADHPVNVTVDHDEEFHSL